jgi:transcriptional regulator
VWEVYEKKMNFFEFTKSEFEWITQECMLDEEYKQLLEYKIRGYSIVKIADLLNCSTARVSVMTKNLKKKIKKII